MNKETAEKAKSLINEVQNLSKINGKSYNSGGLFGSLELSERPNEKKSITVGFGGYFGNHDASIQIPSRYNVIIADAIRKVLKEVESELNDLKC